MSPTGEIPQIIVIDLPTTTLNKELSALRGHTGHPTREGVGDREDEWWIVTKVKDRQKAKTQDRYKDKNKNHVCRTRRPSQTSQQAKASAKNLKLSLSPHTLTGSHWVINEQIQKTASIVKTISTASKIA